MMARLLAGKSLAVRGNAKRGFGRNQRSNPRLSPPRTSPASRRQRLAPEELSKPDVTTKPQTKFDVLAGKPSKFGGTDIERAMDNAAAELGYEFDGAQWIVQLGMTGSYTVIDRVRFHPRVAVYIDGIQHDIRIDAEAQDFLQKLALESEGWKVIRVHWKDIQRDPISAARSVLYVI